MKAKVKRIGERKRRRAVEAEVDMGEAATITLNLTRDGNALADSATEVAAGESTVKAKIPRSVASGPAQLGITMEDAAGNTAEFSRTVVIPERR